MTVDVETSIMIERPKREVAAYAANPANAPDCYVNIASVEWKTPPTGARGIADRVYRAFPRPAHGVHIRNRRADAKLVMRTSEGPFPMETTYTWEDAPNGATRMTLRNRGNPSGFSTLAAPFMAAAMKRANRNDRKALKSRLEGNGRSQHH